MGWQVTERLSEEEFREWEALDGGSALYREARRARESAAALTSDGTAYRNEARAALDAAREEVERRRS